LKVRSSNPLRSDWTIVLSLSTMIPQKSGSRSDTNVPKTPPECTKNPPYKSSVPHPRQTRQSLSMQKAFAGALKCGKTEVMFLLLLPQKFAQPMRAHSSSRSHGFKHGTLSTPLPWPGIKTFCGTNGKRPAQRDCRCRYIDKHFCNKQTNLPLHHSNLTWNSKSPSKLFL